MIYQEGGVLPGVNIETGFLGERVNPLNINFNPNPVPIVDNTISALQLGLQRDSQKLQQRSLDQAEKRLDMDVMKFNKDLIAGSLKQLNAATDPTFGINVFTDKGRQLINKINEERTKAQEQTNALWAETLVTGKVTPINIGKLNQATSGVDKLLQSEDYVLHVTANSAYQKALDEMYKNLDNTDIVVDTEAFRVKEEKLMQMMNSDSSSPKDFRIADVLDMKNVFLKRKDFEEDIYKIIDVFKTDNTDEIAEFYKNNPAIVATKSVEDMTNATKLPQTIYDYLNSSSQGRAFIERLGGQDSALSYLDKVVRLKIPNIGTRKETITDLNTDRYLPGSGANSTSSSTSQGTQVEKDRAAAQGLLQQGGFDVQLPSVLDGKVDYTYTKPDGGLMSESLAAPIAVQRFLDESTSTEEKEAIRKSLGIKKYQAPTSGGQIGNLNTNAAGAITTTFSKINPADTNWDLLSKYESAGGTSTGAYMDNGQVSVGPYSLRGDNIKKFFKDKYGLSNIDISSTSAVQSLWDSYSSQPDFDGKMKDWITNNLHKPRLEQALKYIPVMDNSVKTYLTDAAHQLGTDSYNKMLRRSQEIIKEKGYNHANPFDQLQAVHEARIELDGGKYKESRLDDLYAQSAALASPQAQIAARLPFGVSDDVQNQSHKSYLELEYGMLQQLDNTFSQLPGANKLFATSLSRGENHEKSKDNQLSLHRKGRAMDFRFNDESINIFKQLTGRTSLPVNEEFRLGNSDLYVMYEENPRHFHVSYRGSQVEVPTQPQKAGNPNQSSLNELYQFGEGPVIGQSTQSPSQVQQSNDQRSVEILNKIDTKIK